MRFGRVAGQVHREPGEGANPFAPHRVSLVGHRRGADLVLLERLFDFFAMRQNPQVGRRFVAAGRDAGQRIQHLGIDLSRVSLPGDRVRASNPIFLATSCSSCRTLSWSPSNSSRKLACVPVVPFTLRAFSVCNAVFDFGQIEHKIVGPQACPLANRRRLGRLQVREAERRQIAILLGELGRAR